LVVSTIAVVSVPRTPRTPRSRLAVLVVLSVSQIDLLTAAEAKVDWTLLLPVPIPFVVGAGVAYLIRRRDPSAYAALGSQDFEHEGT